MISMNTDEVLAFIEQYKADVERKLKGMVTKFSYQMTAKAIDITPYGDFSPQVRGRYYSRERIRYGLTPMPGHAKGGWTLTIGEEFTRLGVVANGVNASNVKDSAKFNSEQEYRLGQSIYIGNNVPYIMNTGFTQPEYGSLEGGYSAQAPDGIKNPVLKIASAYSQDFKYLYDQS